MTYEEWKKQKTATSSASNQTTGKITYDQWKQNKNAASVEQQTQQTTTTKQTTTPYSQTAEAAANREAKRDIQWASQLTPEEASQRVSEAKDYLKQTQKEANKATRGFDTEPNYAAVNAAKTLLENARQSRDIAYEAAQQNQRGGNFGRQTLWEKIATGAQDIGRNFVSDFLGSNRGGVNEIGYAAQEAITQEAQKESASSAALNNLFTAVGSNAYSGVSGVEQEASNTLTNTPMRNATDIGSDYAKQVEYDTRNASNFMRGVYDVAGGIGGMVPSIAANLLLPGSGLPVMFTYAAGAATEEALKSGADNATALMYGAAVGGIEVFTEKMFGGIPGLGKGGVDAAVTKAIQKYATDTSTQVAMTYLASALGEGFEEFFAEFADRWANELLIKTDDRTLGETFDDAMYSFLIGALTSAVLDMNPETLKRMRKEQIAESINGKIDEYYAQAQANGLFSAEANAAAQTAKTANDKSFAKTMPKYKAPTEQQQETAKNNEIKAAAKVVDQIKSAGNIAEADAIEKAVGNEDNLLFKVREFDYAYRQFKVGAETVKNTSLTEEQLKMAKDAAMADTTLAGTNYTVNTTESVDSMNDVSYTDNGTTEQTTTPQFNAEEVQNEQSRSRDEEWTDSVAAGGQGGALERARRYDQSRTHQHSVAASRRDARTAQGKDYVNPASIGIKKGDRKNTILVVSRDNALVKNDAELQDIERKLKEINQQRYLNGEQQIDLNYFVGTAGLTDGGSARGWHEGNKIFVRIDAEGATATQIFLHEYCHDLIENEIARTGKSATFEKVRDEILSHDDNETLDMLKYYAELYRGVIGSDEVLTEIVCDAYAGIDIWAHLPRVEAATRYSKTAREAFSKDIGAKESSGSGVASREVNGKTVAWIENSGLSSNQLQDYRSIANYIAKHIGEVYKIIESGQSVYIGEDLPSEYTQSKYTSYLKNRNRPLLRAKNKAVDAFGDMIEIATNRRWEKPIHSGNKDAKYGMYRYDTAFAFPVKDQSGNTVGVKCFDAELVIRNASDGKKYLYDIVNIKENTADEFILLKREDRKAAQSAAPRRGISDTEDTTKSIESQDKSSLSQKVENEEPLNFKEEGRASREFDEKYMNEAVRMNSKPEYGFVSTDAMDKARAQRTKVKGWLDKISNLLPPDVVGKTFISDSSYGGTEELSTVCIRTMAADELMDAIADYLGRPLTVEDTIEISQEIFKYTDKPECLYCYVAMDRKAYREFTGEYLKMRDAAIEDIKSGMSKEEAYQKYLNGRKDTKDQQNRFDIWYNATKNGNPLVTARQMSNTANALEAAKISANMREQVKDALKYAQAASWAKKRISYAAYNNHILRWKQPKIDDLNAHYGLRLYSFSDYSPAFLLENMQMLTDAAVRGLKCLSYTKELDYAKIFAPTGMNINISVFAYKDWNTGEYACDGMQGANWDEAKKLRKKYSNVGCTFVATDDAQVEWALNQNWIDVIIPFHMVRTGTKVAKYFGWDNYTQMSRDLKTKQWDKDTDVKSVTPAMHQNNKKMYLDACEANHLTPRFEKWVNHPNYMKLVNETRQSEGNTKPVQPVFDLTVAKSSIDEMVKRGGYYQHIGGSFENMLEIASEVGDKLQGRASMDDAEYLELAKDPEKNKTKLQAMVDAAAEKAGYTIRAWHGSRNIFTSFSKDKLGSSTNTESSKKWFFAADKETANSYYPRGVMLSLVESGMFKQSDLDSMDRRGVSGKLYELFIKMENPLEVDVAGYDYESHKDAKDAMSEYLNEAEKNGNDGIILYHVRDNNLKPSEENSTDYLFKNPAQAKSADPVTYDDNGNVIPLSERFNQKNEDIRFSREDDLAKENDELREKVEYLRGQLKKTPMTKIKPEDVRRVARKLIKEYNSSVTMEEVEPMLQSLYDDMSAGNDYVTLWDRANAIAELIVDNAQELRSPDMDTYNELKARLKDVKIQVNDKVKGDIPDYNEWRKHLFGTITLSNTGIPIDTLYGELSAQYPGYFPVDVVPPTDQLLQIVDTMNDLKPQFENPLSYYMDEAQNYVANTIMDEFFGTEQVKTYADRMNQRVLKAKLNTEVTKAKYEEALRQAKEDRDKRISDLKDRHRASEKRAKDKRTAAAIRNKIQSHVKSLSKLLTHPTDKKHIPQELQAPVAKLLESINLESNFEYAYGTDAMMGKVAPGTVLGAEPTKRSQRFAELKKIYQEIQADMVVDPDLLGDETVRGLFDEVIELGDKRLDDMTVDELEVVWKTLRAVEASVRSANKMFSNGKYERVSDAANALQADNQDKTSKPEYRGIFGKFQRLITLDMLTPETYFHVLGKSGDNIFRMLRDAQDKYIRLMEIAHKFTAENATVNVRQLDEDMHEVKLGGRKIQLSTSQIMELYVLMNREQAAGHILAGGILPTTTKGKGVKLNRYSEAISGIDISEIQAAIKILTPEQIKLADKMQKFVSSECSKWGNEASMAVYGYKKFGETNYWPIKVNSQTTHSDVQKDTQVVSIGNKGMTKAVKPNAKNSVMLGSIFDTFSRHVGEMVDYAAYLQVSEDVNRIRNFKFRNEDGKLTNETVKGILDRVHGNGGKEYIGKLLQDMAIGVQSEPDFMTGLFGNVKAASVAGNIRVVIQQPTAILRALDMLDAKYLVTRKNPLTGWEKAKKYAAIAQWKDWGYFDVSTGKNTKSLLFDNSTKLDKVNDKLMAPAGVADAVSWGYLWNCVEEEVRATTDLKQDTAEYYHAVAKRFTDIIDHTQVVDGILQRSQIMRSPSGFTKMATAFMGEPTKQLNMMYSSVYDYANAKSDAEKTTAKKRLARSATSLLVSGVVNAVAQSIVDGLRDRDKDQTYWEKFLEAFTGFNGEEDSVGDFFAALLNGNVESVVNVPQYIPYLKDFVSILQGYDVKRMDFDAIAKAVTSGGNLIKALGGGGRYTIPAALVDTFGKVAKLFGVPVTNLKRDVMALVESVAQWSGNYMFQYYLLKMEYKPDSDSNKSLYYEMLYEAKKHDTAAYNRIRQLMIGDGFKADGIDSSMRSREKKEQDKK